MADLPFRPSDNYWTREADLPGAIRLAERLRQVVDWVGRFGTWFILPLVLITCYDVTLRKLKFFYVWVLENFGRIWIFESTLLQELEWHMHTVLFAFVLGYGYIHNTHVRVDLVRERLSFRRKAWLEFLGTTLFLIPYTLTVIWFASIYAYDATCRARSPPPSSASRTAGSSRACCSSGSCSPSWRGSRCGSRR